MAELVDALVSDASEETHGSSSLLGRTNLFSKIGYCWNYNINHLLTYKRRCLYEKERTLFCIRKF